MIRPTIKLETLPGWSPCRWDVLTQAAAVELSAAATKVPPYACDRVLPVRINAHPIAEFLRKSTDLADLHARVWAVEVMIGRLEPDADDVPLQLVRDSDELYRTLERPAPE